MTASTYTVVVADDKAGARLDRVLADALPSLSRTRLKALIEAGGVTGGEDDVAVVDPARRVAVGESFRLRLPPPAVADPQPQPLPLVIVHEDEDLIVIEKPPGLVVHPGAGTPDGTLVNALLAHCPNGLSSIGAPRRPGIVHRLDKDTSGLLVAAKTDSTHLHLARQFAAHSVERAYAAVVWGHPEPVAGRIESRIGRSARDRTRMTVVMHGGKVAVTNFRQVHTVGRHATLVECRLETGRTHQIRVHMATIGHPIVGDPIYRGASPANPVLRQALLQSGIRRQCLHAFLMALTHPRTGERLLFRSKIPNDMKALICCLEAV